MLITCAHTHTHTHTLSLSSLTHLKQNMHERLLEMGKCLPTATPSSTPVTNLRETYCKEKPPPTDEDDDQFKSDVCADELGGRDTPDTDRLG